jgi:hypothetical protein
LVDDNFHYQEADERREQGVYDTLVEAEAVCRTLVDQSLRAEYRRGITAERLYDRYVSFGDDPSIVVVDGTDDTAVFSAWAYAKTRCAAICQDLS